MEAAPPTQNGNISVAPRSLDRMVTLGIVAPLVRRLARPNPRRLPILMYHRISDDPEASVRPYYRLATSPARFAEHLALFAEAGMSVVSMERALAVADSKPDELHRLIAMTFDDGFADFAEAAWPALQRHGFTATVYLPTAFIGADRRKFRGHPCLTWSEVRELRKAGVHFGSHTVTHPVLYQLSWAAIADELARSRAVLEQEIHETIDAFAYPFAYPQFDRAFTSAFEGYLKDAGYAHSVTTRVGRWQPGRSRLALPRLPVNETDDARFLSAKIAGAYDWLAAAQFLTQTVRRALRPLRRGGNGLASSAPGSTSSGGQNFLGE